MGRGLCRRLWALVIVVPLLLSCGGGGDGSGGGSSVEPLPDANYFPLEAAAIWIYANASTGQFSSSTVAGQVDVGGVSGIAIDHVDATDGTVQRLVYVASADGIHERAPADADPLARAFSDMQVMRLPLRLGDSFVQIDREADTGMDLDGDGLHDRLLLHGTLTVAAIETVVTPAGVFEDTVRQRQQIRQTLLGSSGLTVVVDATTDTWYAPGIGPVQRTISLTAEGLSDTVTEVLAAYGVGERRSERVRPQVTQTGPAASQPWAGFGTVVSVTFDEHVAPASVGADTLVVHDAAGARVAGTVHVQGATMRFVPTAPLWTSGTYTATLGTGVTDLFGNGLLAGRTWSFVIDATAPGIARTIPEQLQDVDATAPIVLEFTEAPDPAAVATAFFTLRHGYTGIGVPTHVSVDGLRVTVTPMEPLQASAYYTLDVIGVKDRTGNVMTPASLVVRPKAGRFAWPTPLFTQGDVEAIAVEDLTGDGRNDVLLSATVPGPAFDHRLFVLAGQPGGTLAPPAEIDHGSDLTCRITSIAFGDMDGDGRRDIVAGGDCGAQVLRRTAAGAFVPWQYLPQAVTRTVRVSDLDGDGRLDLVGAGGLPGIWIWKRNAAGSLEVAATPSTLVAPVHVDVGDVNGDGRPDLVAAVQGTLGQDVAVVLQQPDGSFAAPMLMPTGNGSSRAVAVGDLNGDGRADLAATAGGNRPTDIAVFRQAADGTLSTALPLPTYDVPVAARIVDVDGDDRLDLVVSHSGWSTVGVYLQRTDGTLAPEERHESSGGWWNPEAMAVADVNGDGRVDILIEGQLLLQHADFTVAASASRLAGALRVKALAAMRPALR
jgi:hypothetical protein